MTAAERLATLAVSVDTDDIPYEEAGTATAAVSTHAGLSDPHPTYLTASEGNAAYEATGAISTHAAAGDPHTGYRLESADHSHASTGAQGGIVAASAVSFTPNGSIAATDVQSAIQEVRDEAGGGGLSHPQALARSLGS